MRTFIERCRRLGTPIISAAVLVDAFVRRRRRARRSCRPCRWCTGGGDASPIATSTNGKDDTIVWLSAGGALKGVDGDTGAMIYSGGNCSGVRQWTSPIAVKGRIVVGGDGHLCSWSPQ